MDTSAAGRKTHTRRLLRVLADLLECVAVMWISCCAAGVFLVVAIAPRVSDAIADAMPLALAGGVGFTLLWWAASVSGRSSRKIVEERGEYARVVRH